MQDSPINVVWVENSGTPSRSGVWRYNRSLKQQISKDEGIRIRASDSRSEPTGVVGLAVNTLDGKPEMLGAIPATLRPYARLAAKVISPILRLFGLGSLKFFLPLQLPPITERELVHLTDQYLASGMTFMRKRPIVVTVHDIIPYMSKSQLGLNLHQHRSHELVYRAIVRNLRKASAIIADSEFTRQALVEYGQIPASRIHTVHCGVDHSRFFPGEVSDMIWAKLKVKPGSRIVLHVSNEAPHKNFATLIEAFTGLAKAFPSAILVKIGAAHDPLRREQHRAQIERNGLIERTRFIDQVTDYEMADAYRVASVLAAPSLAEGFGLPILEAMACGTPVVCSNAWSLPEVAGSAAITVDPADMKGLKQALTNVLGNDDLSDSLRTRGLKRAAEFTWRRTARETAEVYRSVIEMHEHA